MIEVIDNLEKALEAVQELPQRVMATYARLWQFETWLRQMAYLELRAAFGNNWQQQVAGQPGNRLTADLRLTHMPTPEKNPISYANFSDLQRTIENNWGFFATYLPPRALWTSKLEEISQIRNRVAHFRLGHNDDLERVLRLMRDVDQGFWRFCTSYNAAWPVLPPSKDPVVNRFHHLDQFPYVRIGARKWAMAGIADPNAIFNLVVNVLQRPWQTNRPASRVSGQTGFLYNIVIIGRGGYSFDYSRFLQDTERLHGDLVHLCLGAFSDSIRITIPAILGTRVVNKTIQALLDWMPNSLRRSDDKGDRSDEFQRLAEEWPEYVLGPKNPLCFLTSDMPCSFFTV